MDACCAAGASSLRWSFVVWMNRSGELMEQTLLSVLQHAPQQSEVLVLLDAPYEDPYELEGEVRFVRARGSWAQVANAALLAARGEWIQWLPAGSEVVEGWWAWESEELDQKALGVVIPRVGVAPQVLQALARPEAQWNEWIALESLTQVNWDHPQRWAWELAALGVESLPLFWRRDALLQLGGWPGGLPSPWAEAALLVQLQRCGRTVLHAPDSEVLLPSRAALRSLLIRRWHQERLWLSSLSTWGKVARACWGPVAWAMQTVRNLRMREIPAQLAATLGAWFTYPLLSPRPLLPQVGSSSDTAPEKAVSTQVSSSEVPMRRAA